MIQIPFVATISGDQIFRIELEAQLVTFRFNWNPRTGYWHFSLTDEFGGQIYGVKVVRSWPLLKQSKATLDFLGDLMVLPIDATAGELVGYNDLGTTFGLFYMTALEISKWEAENGLG